MLGVAVRFVGRHPVRFFGVGVVTALGRAAQLDAFGAIEAAGTIILEVIVETARVLLFLSAFGDGRIANGARSLRCAIAQSAASRHARGPDDRAALWREVGWGCGGYLLVALLCNAVIALVVQNTELLQTINRLHPVLMLSATALTLILKNLTIIPFTAVFVAMVTRRFLLPDGLPCRSGTRCR